MPGDMHSAIESRMWPALPWSALAHFTLFALIAAFPVYGQGRAATLRAIALALLLAAVTELAQSFVPGRHPMLRDAAIDLAGTAFGLMALRPFFTAALRPRT